MFLRFQPGESWEEKHEEMKVHKEKMASCGKFTNKNDSWRRTIVINYHWQKSDQSRQTTRKVGSFNDRGLNQASKIHSHKWILWWCFPVCQLGMMFLSLGTRFDTFYFGVYAWCHCWLSEHTVIWSKKLHGDKSPLNRSTSKISRSSYYYSMVKLFQQDLVKPRWILNPDSWEFC